MKQKFKLLVFFCSMLISCNKTEIKTEPVVNAPVPAQKTEETKTVPKEATAEEPDIYRQMLEEQQNERPQMDMEGKPFIPNKHITIFNAQGVNFNGQQLLFTDDKENILEKIGKPEQAYASDMPPGVGFYYNKDDLGISFSDFEHGIFHFSSSPKDGKITIKLDNYGFMITEKTTQAEIISFAKEQNLKWIIYDKEDTYIKIILFDNRMISFVFEKPALFLSTIWYYSNLDQYLIDNYDVVIP